jgi:guanyl-specific ribonuclease Sa
VIIVSFLIFRLTCDVFGKVLGIMKKKITILPYLLAVILCFTLLAGCGKKQQIQQLDTGERSVAASLNASGNEIAETETSETAIDENGTYSSKDDVALYIHIYGKLPSNFITKKEAKALGWPGGGLDDYAPGKSIGGDKFGNYEGQLPEEKGRKYYECDIDTKGKSKRGAKRIIYSNDGLIFYTGDHYESFEQLY